MAKPILIVDDDPDALAYLSEVLRDHGYETVTAGDGDEGLLKARNLTPGLILLDLMMPRKSGITFLNEARLDPELKKIPIVVESGASTATGVDMKHYLEEQPFRDRKKEVLGVDVDIKPDAYLEKPIDPDRLVETVRKFLKA